MTIFLHFPFQANSAGRSPVSKPVKDRELASSNYRFSETFPNHESRLRLPAVAIVRVCPDSTISQQ